MEFDQFDPSICNITNTNEEAMKLFLQYIEECNITGPIYYDPDDELTPYYKGIALSFLILIGLVGEF